MSWPENIENVNKFVVEAKKKEESETTQRQTKEWTAIRGECVSGGELNDLCNLVASAQGKAEIEVVMKKLSCGCLLVPTDSEEDIIL